uniref:Uncharacterized protein n=1 Tax=Rhizophora mucronata TaxID=61149 RepID=A0A2P2NNT2_RHIMU
MLLIHGSVADTVHLFFSLLCVLKESQQILHSDVKCQ